VVADADGAVAALLAGSAGAGQRRGQDDWKDLPVVKDLLGHLQHRPTHLSLKKGQER